MSREVNLVSGITVPMRRGGRNTIRLQEPGISAKLTAVALSNCPSCTSNIRRAGDTARVDITVPETTPLAPARAWCSKSPAARTR